jgi:hypothetical protein
MRLLLLLLALARGARACAVDDDCGLLGDCVAGACACDAGWTGASCSTLALAPAPPDSGLRQANSSSWCGTLLPPTAARSAWTLLSSDMGGCGLGVWITGSRVIEALSPSPLGPFTPTGAVAVAAEAHNPQAIQTPDGDYLLFDSYGGPEAGCASRCNYTTCSGGSMCAPKMGKAGGAGRIIFHAAPSPAGPWAPRNLSIDYPCFSENLTPSPAFLPNGSLALVFHCDAGGARAMGDLVMVRSDDWRAGGAFVRVADVAWRVCGNSAAGGAPGGVCAQPHPEDPFFFTRASRRTGELSFHVIMHNTPRGIHAYSRTGENFVLQQALDAGGVPLPPFVYDEVVRQTDGSSFTAARRERPWLLFDAQRRPAALVTSMQAGVWHNTFTHVQAVA